MVTGVPRRQNCLWGHPISSELFTLQAVLFTVIGVVLQLPFEIRMRPWW